MRFICYLYLLPGKGSWCESTRDVSFLFLKHGSALMKVRLTPTRGEQGGGGGVNLQGIILQNKVNKSFSNFTFVACVCRYIKLLHFED